MYYFQHDVNASIDEKIMQLRLLHGGAAVDAYWYLIERLYKDEQPLNLLDNPRETKLVSFWLCVEEPKLTQWVTTMTELGLLENRKGLWSKRVQDSLGLYKQRAQVSRENGKKGGRPRKNNQTLTQEKPAGFSGETESEPSEKAIKNKNKTKLGFSPEKNPASFETAPASAEAEPSETGEALAPHCPHCDGSATFKPKNGTFRCNSDSCSMTHGELRFDEVVFK